MYLNRNTFYRSLILAMSQPNWISHSMINFTHLTPCSDSKAREISSRKWGTIKEYLLQSHLDILTVWLTSHYTLNHYTMYWIFFLLINIHGELCISKDIINWAGIQQLLSNGILLLPYFNNNQRVTKTFITSIVWSKYEVFCVRVHWYQKVRYQHQLLDYLEDMFVCVGNYLKYLYWSIFFLIPPLNSQYSTTFI